MNALSSSVIALHHPFFCFSVQSRMDAENTGTRDKAIDIYSGSFEASSDVVPIDDSVILSIEQDRTKDEDRKQEHPCLTHTTYLISLAVFGIIGVISRFSLKLLSIGPKNASFLYPDLLSNIIGSFLMGWLGVVFKRDISNISDHIAVGLSTGFLGSLTTFSGWNQTILSLTTQGQWGYAALCLIIGFTLAILSISLGVWTAEIYRQSKTEASACGLHLNQSFLFTFLLATLILLWGSSAALEGKYFKQGSDEAILFLGCLVGPFGVWLRWYLACLNGRGLGKSKMMKWLPLGTLTANVTACCIMAAISVAMEKTVLTRNINIVGSGLQLGFLGSLSTVSTFVSELYDMVRSCHVLRGVCYAVLTLVTSFGFGTLIYSLPIWVNNQ